jgi:hypothetical protein
VDEAVDPRPGKALEQGEPYRPLGREQAAVITR